MSRGAGRMRGALEGESRTDARSASEAWSQARSLRVASGQRRSSADDGQCCAFEGWAGARRRYVVEIGWRTFVKGSDCSLMSSYAES
eukprot:2713764-Pleurochrysis_carterae.AAC.1